MNDLSSRMTDFFDRSFVPLAQATAVAGIVAHARVFSVLANHSTNVRAGRPELHAVKIVSLFEKGMTDPESAAASIAKVAERHNELGIDPELMQYAVIVIANAYWAAAQVDKYTLRVSITEYLARVREFADQLQAPISNVPQTGAALKIRASNMMEKTYTISAGLRHQVLTVLESDWFTASMKRAGLSQKQVLEHVLDQLPLRMGAALKQ